MKGLCDGKTSCSIPVNQATLNQGSDPCPSVTDKYLVVAATGCTPVDPPAPPWATLDPALDGSWGTAWEDECGTLAGELCTSGKVQHTVCFLIEGSSGTMVHIMRSKGIKDKSGNRFEGVLNGKAQNYLCPLSLPTLNLHLEKSPR